MDCAARVAALNVVIRSHPGIVRIDMSSMFRGFVTFALAAALAGCATPRIDTEWRDPTAPTDALKGRRVLVACRTYDESLRRVCEDEWVRQFGFAGIAAVPAYAIPGFPPDAGDLSDAMRAAARERDAAVVASTTLQLVGGGYGRPAPAVGVGVGATGGSGGGNFGFGGISISLPMGGGWGSSAPGLGSSTSIVDVATGKLLWSANAGSPSASDRRGQIVDLTRVTVDAMRKAGLI
jgi:hypothetical protein